MIRHVRPIIATLAVAAWLALSAGCAPQEKAGTPSPQPRDTGSTLNSALDPCAGNLHDLCGALLFHIDVHGRFPPSLQALESGPGGSELRYTCPVSGRPYVYNPGGIHLVERRAYVIVYDATPAHRGSRWAIVLDEPEEDKAPVMHVVALPESLFLFRSTPPAQEPEARR